MTQRLVTQVAPAVSNLTVLGLAGLQSPRLDLQSAGNPAEQWRISLPRSAFPGVDAQPGDTVVLAMTLVRTAVEDLPESPLIIPAGRAS